MATPHDATFDIDSMIGVEPLAKHISGKWVDLEASRADWSAAMRELQSYVYATDTSETLDYSGSEEEWRNTTTVPKLCSIRDTLHAHYSNALFPNSNYVTWEAAEKGDFKLTEIAAAIKAYMVTKLEDSNFRDVTSKLLYDWIDYGNCFAEVIYEDSLNYTGARVQRIHPESIVFDVGAESFKRTPKIVRKVFSLGELHKEAANYPESPFAEAVIKSMELRSTTSQWSNEDAGEWEALKASGFGGQIDYFTSDHVEVLQFQGDLFYDDKLHENRRIYVFDRSYIALDENIPAWYDGSTIEHVGWRPRPHNLMAMGVLENIVGIQYRIDYLQNLKSDALSLTVFPPLKVKGYVDDFEYAPMERIYTGDEGDVEMMPPDASALNANIEIDWLELKMEEVAGVPRMMSGIAHSSRQTAFEIQKLDDNANTLFTDKLLQFESQFIEPIMNLMVGAAKNNLNTTDVARSMNDSLGVQEFINITPDILKTSGKIKPKAARFYQERSQMIQNLNNYSNSALGQDPQMRQHVSYKKLSKAAIEGLGLSEYNVWREWAGIEEQVEAESYASQLQQAAVQEEEDDLMQEDQGLDQIPTE